MTNQQKIKSLLARSPDRLFIKIEKIERAVSFAYGNVAIEIDDVTRNMVENKVKEFCI